MDKIDGINVELRRAEINIRRVLANWTLHCAAWNPHCAAFEGTALNRTNFEAKDWMIGMELFPDGKVRERDLDVYRSLLLFDTNEVLSHWPSEPIADGPDIESNGPISAFSITAKRSSNNSEVTTAWMEGFAIAFVSWGQKPKRDDAINTKTR